jgi:diazepam-binding inhibitor (GABA receptor modulating acyl-CoA-binding protein)
MSQEAFDAAVAWVKDPAAVGEKPLKGVPTSRKLDLYKFYKQATEGDVKGSQPWAVQVTNRSKWDAWKTVEGTSAEDARQGYVDELAKQKEEFPRET